MNLLSPPVVGRRRILRTTILAAALALSPPAGLHVRGTTAAASTPYHWPHDTRSARSLDDAIPPPSGFVRRPAPVGSFAHWLRGLPMKPYGSPVHLFDGRLKARQDVHVAIIDIDTGKRDLQQCADAVMRLRAEWLFGTRRASDIAFNYTSGNRVSFARWSKGERPDAEAKRWTRRAAPDSSYRVFRTYMNAIFSYAGTYSLARELTPVQTSDLSIGDVFIMGGFPGHAVLVADMVEHPTTGEKRFLLVQSYMPAQDIHVLRNPDDPTGSPWYPARFSWPLATPEWSFPMGSLKRWRQ